MATTETKLNEVQRTVNGTGTGLTMKALVYHGPGKRAWEEKPRPVLKDADDAIVRITTTTICGTDLHILEGDVPRSPTAAFSGMRASASSRKSAPGCTPFSVGDKVLVSCITSCGRCDFCRKNMYSHCRNGGWILGNRIDGTQAEYIRIPHADTSLYLVPADADEEALVMLSDILPTGFECGVLNGQVNPRRYGGDRRRRSDRPGGSPDRAVLLAGGGHHDRPR